MLVCTHLGDWQWCAGKYSLHSALGSNSASLCFNELSEVYHSIQNGNVWSQILSDRFDDSKAAFSNWFGSKFVCWNIVLFGQKTSGNAENCFRPTICILCLVWNFEVDAGVLCLSRGIDRACNQFNALLCVVPPTWEHSVKDFVTGRAGSSVRSTMKDRRCSNTDSLRRTHKQMQSPVSRSSQIQAQANIHYLSCDSSKVFKSFHETFSKYFEGMPKQRWCSHHITGTFLYGIPSDRDARSVENFVLSGKTGFLLGHLDVRIYRRHWKGLPAHAHAFARHLGL